MRRNKALDTEKGFTIIELLIATAVLSFILLLVTVVITSIGNLYTKGVNISNVQDSVRNITDDLSSELELNGGDVVSVPEAPPNAGALCIGDVRYNYVLYEQLGSTSPPYHVLWQDTTQPGVCTAMTEAQLVGSGTPSGSTNGTELLAANTRLTAFSVAGTSPYTITVGVAYGDDDLLCDSDPTPVAPTDTFDCGTPGETFAIKDLINNPGTVNIPVNYIVCKTQGSGDQYCATSYLNTVVSQRLQQ